MANVPGEVPQQFTATMPKPQVANDATVNKSNVKFCRSVVVALDESHASQHALRWTLKNFVRPSDDDLIVLAVLKTSTAATTTVANNNNDNNNDNNGLDEKFQQQAAQMLLEKYASFTIDQFKGRRETNNLSVTGIVLNAGNFNEKLLKKAEKVNACSIIVGCNGQGDPLFGSSMRSYIFQNSSIPLVLVRAPLTTSLQHQLPSPFALTPSSLQSPPFVSKEVAAAVKPQKAPRQTRAHIPHSGASEPLPRDEAVQAEINANPEWFVLSNATASENLSVHPKKKQAKTPERYLRIRNFILDEWFKNTSRFLTKTSARRGLLQREGDVNAIGRVFDFLQTNGYINYGNIVRVDQPGGRKRKASVSSSSTEDYHNNNDNNERLPKILSPFQK